MPCCDNSSRTSQALLCWMELVIARSRYDFMLCRRGAQQQKKKLFDPAAGDDTWKHDRFELLDLPPEEDDYRVRFSPKCAHSHSPGPPLFLGKMHPRSSHWSALSRDSWQAEGEAEGGEVAGVPEARAGQE